MVTTRQYPQIAISRLIVVIKTIKVKNGIIAKRYKNFFAEATRNFTLIFCLSYSDMSLKPAMIYLAFNVFKNLAINRMGIFIKPTTRTAKRISKS